jgi:hypothetical protein
LIKLNAVWIHLYPLFKPLVHVVWSVLSGILFLFSLMIIDAVLYNVSRLYLFYFLFKIVFRLFPKRMLPIVWQTRVRVRVMMFNATFNNISVRSWRSVLLVEENGENHRPATSHWQTLSHNSVSSTPRHERDSN